MFVPCVKCVDAPLWSKVYFHGEGNCVIQTVDGGYAIAGIADGKMVLIKTDAAGNLHWTRAYWNGTAYQVLQTSDGGYVLAGSGIVFKTDPEGNVEWNRTLTRQFDRPWGRVEAIFHAFSLIQTRDGGYMLTGYTSEERYLHVDCVIKITPMGIVHWTRTYGSQETNSYATSVVETSDGGFLISGIGMIYGDPSGIIIKTDKSGDVQWNKNIPEAGTIYKIVETNDGYVLVDNGAKLVKTDLQGNVQWTGKYGESGHFFKSAIQTSDGGYIIAGNEIIFGPELDYTAWIVKTDAAGNMECNFKYKPEGKNSKATHIIESSDGNYVFTGSYGGYYTSTAPGMKDESRPGDIWLVKIAPLPGTKPPPDTKPPAITILSPENKTYTISNIPLIFTVDESTSLMAYSLDGQDPLVIIGNTTLQGLSEGPHNLTVYAKDAAGNTGTSSIHFTMARNKESPPQESSQTIWVLAAIIMLTPGIALILHYRKHVKAKNVKQISAESPRAREHRHASKKGNKPKL